MNLENTILIGIVAFIAIVLIILLAVSLKRKSKIEIHRKRYMIDPIVKIDDKQYNKLVNKICTIKENTNTKRRYEIFISVTVLSFIVFVSVIHLFIYGKFSNEIFYNLYKLINEGNVIIGLVIPLSIFIGLFFELFWKDGKK
ncbi:MAG: hypothetical protein R3Y64_11315 [Peptostreptococcaceae bacterium]